jgi:Domain of unknown function (DUF4167)
MVKNGTGHHGNGQHHNNHGGPRRNRLRGGGGFNRNGNSGGSGNRPTGSGRNQTYDSNGPIGRVRGNASQVYERYMALARDAAMANDTIMAESFNQHAEHYYRIMLADGYNPNASREAKQQEEGALPPLDGASGDSAGQQEGGEQNMEVPEPDMAEMMPSFLRPTQRPAQNPVDMAAEEMQWDDAVGG